HVHIVTSACGKPSAGRPAATSSSRNRTLAAAKPAGVVLYADASHPSPSRATRRSPAADPQLPTHSGTVPACRGHRAAQQSPQQGHGFLETLPPGFETDAERVIVAA